MTRPNHSSTPFLRLQICTYGAFLFLIVTRERGAQYSFLFAVFGWYLGNGSTVAGSVAGVGVKASSYGEEPWAFRVLLVSRYFLF